MSLSEIIEEVTALTTGERRRLSAFLAKLEVEKDSEYWDEIRRRSDDTEPEKWVSLEELSRSE